MIKVDDIKIGDILYSKGYETYDIVSCVLIKNQTIYISVITPTSRNFLLALRIHIRFLLLKILYVNIQKFQTEYFNVINL